MQENSYIQVLIQSLHQKVEALDSIIEKNQEQYEILSAEEADMDAFEKNIDEKSQYIDKIVFLDDGFEEIYTRVKEELDGNRAAYTEEIQKMKDLISMITERSMKIQVQEQRNKELAGMQFSKARKKIRQVKAGNKAATQYYKNMQQMDAIPPQYQDKKKNENQRGNAIMNNAELLVEIEKLLDRKLEEKLDQQLEVKLEEKLDRMLDEKLDEKLDKKLDEKLDAKFKEELGPIRQDIQELKTVVHHTNMRLDVDVVPRLQTIESCYLDTYERYKDGAEDIENLKGDMELVKGILQEHSRELQRMSAR